jgi:hypothetical protein
MCTGISSVPKMSFGSRLRLKSKKDEHGIAIKIKRKG